MRRMLAAVAMSMTATAIARGAGPAPEAWSPAKATIMTRWAKEVSPDNALVEYPRPQMVREAWTNLNGLWDYAIVEAAAEAAPASWDGRILVPFAIESALSGVGKRVGPGKALWYQRTFERPATTAGGRLLLHFGAVDWQATVWVNGTQVGEHRGGYDPFTCDITDAIKGDGAQTLTVRVWDPSDAGAQPRGKQVERPEGIWYTPVTGIWQTVWLGPVPASYIQSLKITPHLAAKTAEIEIGASAAGQTAMIDRVELPGISGVKVETTTDPTRVIIRLENPRTWSPEDPYLYPVKITWKGPDGKTDTVESYFGMRSIEMKKDEAGFNRMFLNGKPVFEYGPLDQGWWPDGLYTAPTDAALRSDIEVTRQMGFNMCRKHVKVEPARWYYWADKLGLLVWQDMPSIMQRGKRMQAGSGSHKDVSFTPEEHATYMSEWEAIMAALHNHPSIVVWVPFNEGWGQHQTNEVIEWTMRRDPSRLVDGPSGWEDLGAGSMKDMHNYPGPGMFAVMDERISVLGEFGGLGLPVKDHLWQPDRNWGYRTYKDSDELGDHYRQLMINLHRLIGKGLAAAVYTQTTDVEGEVNGLLTYDREICKIGVEKLAKWNAELYMPPPMEKTIVPTSAEAPQQWRYTTTAPADDWMKPDFDASNWHEAPGGFGTPETPNTTVRTRWDTPDIWIRRTVELDAGAGELMLSIYHDEDAEVFINGVPATTVKGFVTNYVTMPLSAAATAALREGRNVIAIHCHQTGGGQYVDAGLIRLVPQGGR
ncbi:MAG: beta-galactosidase [Planctomycetes bacterium]|nr:beta-galactosidase [Planctomycetota bacterium]